MSLTYTVSLNNQTGAGANYVFFLEPPGSATIFPFWMPVWQTMFVPDKGFYEIQTQDDWFAWAGITQTPLAPGVIIGAGMSLPARLGTGEIPGSSFELKVEHDFSRLVEIPPRADPGAFSVETNSDFLVPNSKYLIGTAKLANSGHAVPVGVMAPSVNMKISIAPKLKLFIAQSEAVVGEIVDYQEIVRNAAAVDFSYGEGQGKHYARVVQEINGRFTVIYSEDDE